MDPLYPKAHGLARQLKSQLKLKAYLKENAQKKLHLIKSKLKISTKKKIYPALFIGAV